VKQLARVSTRPTSQERTDLLTSSKLAQFTRVSGKEALEMVLVSKRGPMEPSTRENGVRTELTARASLSTLTATCMMVSGRTTKLTGQAFTSMLTALCTKESGKTIYNMARGLRPGLTKVSMRVSMLSEGNMESELTSGTMEANILETGARTK